MAPLRARRRAAVVVALVLPAVLAAACTISSESPDAAALGTRSGPASGTTTTATGVDGAAPPSAPEPQQDVPSGDGAEAAETPSGEGPALDVGEDETPGEIAAEPPTVTTAADSNAAEQPASAEQGAERAGSAATAGDDGSADSGEGDSGAGAETPVPTTGTIIAAGGGAFDERSKVSTVGIGAVYFGMSPEEAAERVGAVWAGIPAGGSDCYVMTPANGPPGVALWVYHGTVERVDVDTPLLRTQSGLGVGTHLGELRSLLGEKLVVEEHPYLAGWILATFVPTDPNDAAFRIAFDISGGEVIRFRAGRTEIVALEACA
ncbi:MAG: hypothetical protein OXH28_08670 [bacterium]|nr:hypothetical protein [bacterium]